MSKQKFQIGDKVYVKHGCKDEIGRIGDITDIHKIADIHKYSGRLRYLVKYNDNKYPKSGIFYADMLQLISDMQANYIAKEYTVKDENTKCKYCGTPFNEIPESKSESEVCEYCEEKRAMISEIKIKKSASVDLHEFSSFGQEGDWLEVSEWANGEGIDIILEYSKRPSNNISLSYDELEAIINIVNKFGTLPPIYTKNEIEK